MNPQPADQSAAQSAAEAAAQSAESAARAAEVSARSQERLAERLTDQLARHWANVRADARQPRSQLDINAGESDFRSGRVPYGVDLTAAWAWRFLVIVAAGYLVARAIGFLMLVVMPVVIAMLIAALVAPVVNRLARSMPRGLASLLVVITGIGLVSLMLTFATQQVVTGANDLADQVVDGLDQIRSWLKTGPLHASEKQIDDAVGGLQNIVSTGNDELVSKVTELGALVGHVVAGFFIILFSTYFFLSDGDRIWAWVVRIFPRAARRKLDSSGRVAWASITQFVRATVLVAATDAAGIALGAAVLRVPFVAAIAVLVFLGAFVPMVGAFVSGSVAVLVALVAHGPLVALAMLGVVVLIQQIEAHGLQPFLMGRFVRVHPLGVILAIATGVVVAGIPGALVAVPLAAAVNAVAIHLSNDEVEPGPGEIDLGDPPHDAKVPGETDGSPHTQRA